ncbi:Ssb Single-stranded DNA-binding protein [uncultured Caudovirales phage]|uniref:Single-stranded DNA-binding protein n=1 Tax=uncultured Caudovirales phage TaxID=2100421 RepID=A0A6J7VM97_9CAUD|nr:Ssb Single-stranded DNA-binding protein [uncultured Caudovirales phage]
MSFAFNKVIIGGNLTRDPQVKFTSKETAVANFGLAINARYKASDGTMKEDVTFVDVEAWGRTAELCGQYLTKGRAVLVEGRLKLDTWEKDGQKHSKMRVRADTVQFIGGGEKRDDPRSDPHPGNPDAPAERAKGTTPPPPADDEPPF